MSKYFIHFPISPTLTVFQTATDPDYIALLGCLTQSERAGAGKGYVGPLFFCFDSRISFYFIYDNPKQHRKSEKEEELKDGEAISSDDHRGLSPL